MTIIRGNKSLISDLQKYNVHVYTTTPFMNVTY